MKRRPSGFNTFILAGHDQRRFAQFPKRLLRGRNLSVVALVGDDLCDQLIGPVVLPLLRDHLEQQRPPYCDRVVIPPGAHAAFALALRRPLTSRVTQVG
jgi:hypothetical protein